MKKNNAFRRAAALIAALSITVSLAAPAFADTYYIDYGDITITKNEDGSQTIEQGGDKWTDKAGEETVITTSNTVITTLESDLEGPAAEDSDFGPVVEDNYQSAQPEDAEESEDADQPEIAEEPKSADRQESADQQAAPAAAPADTTPVNPKDDGFWGNTITVINNIADKVLNLTLKDVKIDVSDTGDQYDWDQKGKAALSVQGKGNVEIELDGENELKSGAYRAGLEKNNSTSAGTLTLKDNKEAGSGSLNAEGGALSAGIGACYEEGTKNIIITGGTVTATGGDGGAGIGGGDGGGAENITITGSTVTATGGSAMGFGGAGIGGGSDGRNSDSNGKNITITGSTVTAKGGNGSAGIGGGVGGSGESITITGSTVTAEGGNGAAGIGSGNGKNITITDSTVTATGGIYGAGIGGGVNASGSNVTVSGAAQVTAIAGKPDRNGVGAGATIGNGDSMTEDGEIVDGKKIQADISGLTTTGYIRHMIYNEDDSVKQEWWEYGHLQPAPDTPNAPAEESNEVDLGTPGLHVETLEGDLLPFDAQQQGSTLRVTSDNLAARLHGTRQALEALREQGVEQIQFVTSFKTTTLSVEDLLAEGGSWFALEHNGLVSRRLSAAQAESLKCRMR